MTSLTPSRLMTTIHLYALIRSHPIEIFKHLINSQILYCGSNIF